MILYFLLTIEKLSRLIACIYEAIIFPSNLSRRRDPGKAVLLLSWIPRRLPVADAVLKIWIDRKKPGKGKHFSVSPARHMSRDETRRDRVFLPFPRIDLLLLLFRARDSSRRDSAGFNDAFAVRVINRDRRTRLIFFEGVLLLVGFTTMSYIYRRSFAASVYSPGRASRCAMSSSRDPTAFVNFVRDIQQDKNYFALDVTRV